MSSHSSGHSSGANSNQDGVSNMRMIVRRIFEWGSVGVAIVILIVAIKIFIPWTSLTSHPLITTTTAVVATAQQVGPCNYLKTQTVFGNEKPAEPQNPGGTCGIDLYYDGAGNGLYIQSAGDDIVLGPFYRGEEIPLDAEYIWSAGAPFKGAYKLVATRYK